MNIWLSSLIWTAAIMAAVPVSLCWKPEGQSEQKMSVWKKTAVLAVSAAAAAVCGCVSGLRGDPAEAALKRLLFLAFLNMAAVTDMRYARIPNRYTVVICGLGLLFRAAQILNGEEVLSVLGNSFGAALVSLLFFLAVAKFSRGGIGEGDIKVFSALAFFRGPGAEVYTVVFSFIFASLASVLLLLAKKKNMKDGIPMAPFIWAGFLAGILLDLV